MNCVKDFYNDIADYYHLIYSDWEQSIAHQAKCLSEIIKNNWHKVDGNILDCTCGIGTQSLGLANLGYKISCSDISENAIKRAKEEAKKRNLKIKFTVSDIRSLPDELSNKFDFVISCDNSLPHLPNKAEVLKGLQQMFKCTKFGGGAIISVRDYEKEKQIGLDLIPYGIRQIGSAKIAIFQIRDYYKKDYYRISLYFVYDYGNPTCNTLVFRSKYFAISIDQIMHLMKQVGFINISRIDNCFFQPVIVATKPLGGK